MRRSTAAVVGTLTGAALIIGARLGVTPPGAPPAAAPAAAGLVEVTPSPQPSVRKSAARTAAGTSPRGHASSAGTPSAGTPSAGGSSPRPKATTQAPASGLGDGVYKGKPDTTPYGTVQVTIRIDGGKIAAADATFPTAGRSGTINPPAVATLNQETLKAQSADIAIVSGATYTSESYRDSLQAALDAASA